MAAKNRVSVTLSDFEYRRLLFVSRRLGVSNSLVLTACWSYSAGVAEHVAGNQRDFDGRDRPIRRNTAALLSQLTCALMAADGRVIGAEGDTMDMFPVSLDISSSDDAA